jgi:ubiquinone/menaquinone biosynthesis C-methylase UbiE
MSTGTDHEWGRLLVEARMVEPFTRQLLLEAGLRPGMRVLDVGSGLGDTAFLMARLVGPSGSVVGADRSARAVEVATERAIAEELRNVSFVQADPTDLGLPRAFDAVVGRYVLMWQPNPGPTLARFVRHARPGGTVAFHEQDWASARSYPTVGSWDRCCVLVAEAVTASGADPEVGSKLHSLFVGAGLPSPSMRRASLMGAGPDQARLTNNLLASLLHDIERWAVLDQNEIDFLAALAEEALGDVTAAGSIVLGRSDVGAWGRRPE